MLRLPLIFMLLLQISIVFSLSHGEACTGGEQGTVEDPVQGNCDKYLGCINNKCSCDIPVNIRKGPNVWNPYMKECMGAEDYVCEEEGDKNHADQCNSMVCSGEWTDPPYCREDGKCVKVKRCVGSKSKEASLPPGQTISRVRMRNGSGDMKKNPLVHSILLCLFAFTLCFA